MQVKDGYTFKLNKSVLRKKIFFTNRYGIELAGDIYFPNNSGNSKLAAIAISGPFGAVKEQASGLYANELAKRGFIALAFDPSYTGESGGSPRNLASPEINTEDFSAAVDYLGMQPEVNPYKIGVLGICGFGGMALNATASDKRIKAVVTTSMYDMTRIMGSGMNDSFSKADRSAILTYLSNKRWQDLENGHNSYAGHGMSVSKNGIVQQPSQILPDQISADDDPVTKEFFDYYRTDRGFAKNSVNSTSAFVSTMPISFMNMPILSYVDEISPRPLLLIAGEEAHSRYFSEDIYDKAIDPKELVIIPGANHVDLYDNLDKIPFSKIQAFYEKNLTK